MQAKINKRLVDVTEATEGKPVFVFDTELAGFVLKVTPSGGRTYQLRYRMGGRDAALKIYTIGKHGPLTPDQARRVAEGLVGDISRGIDPAVAKVKKQAEDRGALTSRLRQNSIPVSLTNRAQRHHRECQVNAGAF